MPDSATDNTSNATVDSTTDSTSGNPSPGTVTEQPADPVNPITDAEQPYFIISSKPADASTFFTDLASATAAADAMATLHPGVEIYVLEARVSALAPAPAVVNSNLPQS